MSRASGNRWTAWTISRRRSIWLGFRSPEQLPPEVVPARWLKGSARRMALNFFRRSKRREDRRLTVLAECLAMIPWVGVVAFLLFVASLPA